MSEFPDLGEIRYARSGDIDIAYSVTGSGPVDLVFVPGFISHLELSAEFPPLGNVLRVLGRWARVLAFDKRGTGLSERTLGFGSLAERTDDIRAVMDAAGWERAHMLGISEGGPMAMLFSGMYPDRVASLAIYGSMARILRAPDYPEGLDIDVGEFCATVAAGWGTGNVLGGFLNHAPDPEAAKRLTAKYERSACTPQMVSTIMRCNLEIDVRTLLPAVSVPTLIFHCTGDPAIPVGMGRYLARHIPGAEYVELPLDVHGTWVPSETEQLLAPLEEFITGEHRPVAEPDRVLATVLFTDIVDSTRRTAELGDRRWRDVLDRHDTTAHRVVGRYGGRVVKSTGDGLLATFDSPARGVRCASEMHHALAPIGIQIRAGLHTGEVELRGEDIGGIAVHLGARVAATADAGEVLVSRTVRDLVTGSDLTFDDRGSHSLKGVDEPWQLYALAGNASSG